MILAEHPGTQAIEETLSIYKIPSVLKGQSSGRWADCVKQSSFWHLDPEKNFQVGL